MGPNICSTIFATHQWYRPPLGVLKAIVGDGERKRQFWPLEPQGVCNSKGQQNGSLISLRTVAPLPPPSLFLLTTIDACFSETNHWWHLTYAVKKEEGKVERGQENAPRKASLEYRVRLPFLYQSVISFMEPNCKHQRDHGSAFLGSLAGAGCWT